MKTRKNKQNGGENTHLEKIVDKIIKIGMMYRTNSFTTTNDFNRLFVHSNCFNEIAQELTKKVVTMITPNNSAFQQKYATIKSSTRTEKHFNHKIQISLIALILHYAGLLVGITNTNNLINIYEIIDEEIDDGDYELIVDDDNANVMYSSWMVYHIFNDNKKFITDAFNQNNITKIKALISRVPQIADAETIDMLTEYFRNEKPKPIKPFKAPQNNSEDI
jgi:hypothetical protein